MSDIDIESGGLSVELVQEYELDAPPEKVWRAISIAEFREQWLPSKALAQAESVSAVPGEEVRYRLRDELPPHLESEVTLRIRGNEAGGTALTIIHQARAAEGAGRPEASNDGAYAFMRAA